MEERGVKGKQKNGGVRLTVREHVYIQSSGERTHAHNDSLARGSNEDDKNRHIQASIEIL